MEKSPLDPGAGSVSVPSTTGHLKPHNESSISHNLNSGESEKDVGQRVSSPGIGTNANADNQGPPQWQEQENILNAASSGKSLEAGKSHANVENLRAAQHPQDASGQQSGPTGLLSGSRNMEAEGTSQHDALQDKLLDGEASKDGEGSAGLPFDAGK